MASFFVRRCGRRNETAALCQRISSSRVRVRVLGVLWKKKDSTGGQEADRAQADNADNVCKEGR